jgi:hypothetical protein
VLETIHEIQNQVERHRCGTDNDFDRPSRWTGASLHRCPGTSCLATISLSLRDKSHSPIEAPRNYLSTYAVETLSWVLQPFSGSVIVHKKKRPKF